MQPSSFSQWKNPHFVALCPSAPSLCQLPPPFPLSIPSSLGRAVCPGALTWAFPVSHLLSLCPCPLQRREVRPPDGHLDLHRCHEHPEALRPRGHARWVLPRGAGGSWAGSVRCWGVPLAALPQFLPSLPRPDVLPASALLSLADHWGLSRAPEGTLRLFPSSLGRGAACG